MKVISDTAHGLLDYFTVAIFALAPSILGLSGFAALVSYALAAIHLCHDRSYGHAAWRFQDYSNTAPRAGGNACRTCACGGSVGAAEFLGDKREFFLVMGLVILRLVAVKLRSFGRGPSDVFELTNEDFERISKTSAELAC